MKRKMICSSALMACLSVSTLAFGGGIEIVPIEDYFTGFYVGGTGAAHFATLNGSSSLVSTDDFPVYLDVGVVTLSSGAFLSQDADGSSVDGYGGVQGGFGWTFNHAWYLGVQGFGEWGSQSRTSDFSGNLTLFPDNVDPTTGTETSNVGSVTESTTVKISNDYGVAGKIGYVLAPRTLIYGKVGASWANLKVSNTATFIGNSETFIDVVTNRVLAVSSDTKANQLSSNEENKLGLLLGLGFEQFIYQDIVSLNVEYDYVNYGSVSTGPVTLTKIVTVTSGTAVDVSTPETVPVITQASGSATVSSLLGGINFYFGRNWF